MSFLFKLEERDEFVADAIGDVGSKLQAALRTRKSEDGLTQNEIAEKLDIDRSRVNKCLSGFSNLTIKSLAELVWAMDGRLTVGIHLNDRKPVSDGIHASSKSNIHISIKSAQPKHDASVTNLVSQNAAKTSKIHAL